MLIVFSLSVVGTIFTMFIALINFSIDRSYSMVAFFYHQYLPFVHLQAVSIIINCCIIYSHMLYLTIYHDMSRPGILCDACYQYVEIFCALQQCVRHCES